MRVLDHPEFALSCQRWFGLPSSSLESMSGAAAALCFLGLFLSSLLIAPWTAAVSDTFWSCSLALFGFVIMHGRLCALNMTTIEAYEKRPVK